MKQWKRVIVVGASAGIGKALAEALLKEGSSVALVSRNEGAMNAIAHRYPGKALVFPHDVRHYEEVPALFQRIAHDLGGLDLIIYAAGIMREYEPHEYNFTKDRETIEVNTLGAFAWLDETAKRFEQVKGGTIIGISSIAGERGRSGNVPYFASKAALTTYLESLRNRLSKYKVKVVTIKPGFVDTAMLLNADGSRKSFIPWLISPERAAQLILRAASRGKNTAYIPGRWRFVSMVMHLMPSFIFRRLSF